MCVFILFYFFYFAFTHRWGGSISNAIVTKSEQKTFARAAARKGSHTHTHTSLKLAPSQEAWLTFGCIKVLMKPCCSAQTQTHTPAVFTTRVLPQRTWPRCHVRCGRLSDLKAGRTTFSNPCIFRYPCQSILNALKVSSGPLGGPKKFATY